MNSLEEGKAKQFAVEQSERIKQDYEDVMFPNRNATSYAQNLWRGILESQMKKQKSTKDVFNNLQSITSDTASIYNQIIGTAIKWDKIEKKKYSLGYKFYDLEEILAINPNKILPYESKGYFGNSYFVELADYSSMRVSSFEEAKKLAEMIKGEVETIQNSINRKELNPYFRELHGKDIPYFSQIDNSLKDITSVDIMADKK